MKTTLTPDQEPAELLAIARVGRPAGWAWQNHFLPIEIWGEIISIMPISYEAMRVRDNNDKPVPLPIMVRLPGYGPSNSK